MKGIQKDRERKMEAAQAGGLKQAMVEATR